MAAEKNAPIYIIDGVRTPFIKTLTQRGDYSAADLGTYVTRELLLRQNLAAGAIDQVVSACVIPREDEANIARIIGLRAGLSEQTPAFTVARNCGAGLQALDSAFQSLLLYKSSCTLVVATEVMSRAPLIMSHRLSNWFLASQRLKGMLPWLRHMLSFPLSAYSPIPALQYGLTDPMVEMIMGKTAEEIAYHYNISRSEMDVFALESHQKALQAWDDGMMTEVVPLISSRGVIERDTGMRSDLSLKKLSELKPAFERHGTITAGNSSQVTDGAGALLLATAEFVDKYHLQPLGIVHDICWSGCQPAMMGLGPVRAMAQLMQKHELSWDDFDAIEINEAFAAQVLGVVKSFDEPDLGTRFCQIATNYGPLPREKLNMSGGAIALGHPIAASGLRLVLRALTSLKQHQNKNALVSLCIGGGQGGAAWVEAC
jgi:acetyl-CoA C-acetyltransferase